MEQVKYRVVARDSSESYAGNAMTYPTITDAIEAGHDLYDRWMACRSFAVIDADLPRDTGAPHGSVMTWWTRETVMDHCHYSFGEDP